MTLGGKFAGFTECTKLSGAIPDNKYNSSTLVGLKHPVIARHALLSFESSLYACADLAHSGAEYSATE